MSQQSLKDKTIKGTMWSAADAFLGQGVTFLVGIVLARLLSPDEYGLIGICLIFNTVLCGIVDSGFSNALIRKKDCTDDDYNTMFFTNLGFSIVLYGLLFVSSPLVAHFFGRQELTDLVRATGLLLFFNALSITQVTILTKRIDFLKNFGFAGETTVVGPGINSKVDEMRSAYGLLNLRQVDAAIAARQQVAIKYREALRDVEGITFFDDMPGVKHNYSYFPIFIDEKAFGMSRDALYAKMKEANVLGRRYFYPLISEFSTYRGLESSNPKNLPNAHKMADSVLCLPMHHELSDNDIQRTIEIIKL